MMEFGEVGSLRAANRLVAATKILGGRRLRTERDVLREFSRGEILVACFEALLYPLDPRQRKSTNESRRIGHVIEELGSAKVLDCKLAHICPKRVSQGSKHDVLSLVEILFHLAMTRSAALSSEGSGRSGRFRNMTQREGVPQDASVATTCQHSSNIENATLFRDLIAEMDPSTPHWRKAIPHGQDVQILETSVAKSVETLHCGKTVKVASDTLFRDLVEAEHPSTPAWFKVSKSSAGVTDSLLGSEDEGLETDAREKNLSDSLAWMDRPLATPSHCPIENEASAVDARTPPRSPLRQEIFGVESSIVLSEIEENTRSVERVNMIISQDCILEQSEQSDDIFQKENTQRLSQCDQKFTLNASTVEESRALTRVSGFENRMTCEDEVKSAILLHEQHSQAEVSLTPKADTVIEDDLTENSSTVEPLPTLHSRDPMPTLNPINYETARVGRRGTSRERENMNDPTSTAPTQIFEKGTREEGSNSCEACEEKIQKPENIEIFRECRESIDFGSMNSKRSMENFRQERNTRDMQCSPLSGYKFQNLSDACTQDEASPAPAPCGHARGAAIANVESRHLLHALKLESKSSFRSDTDSGTQDFREQGRIAECEGHRAQDKNVKTYINLAMVVEATRELKAQEKRIAELIRRLEDLPKESKALSEAYKIQRTSVPPCGKGRNILSLSNSNVAKEGTGKPSRSVGAVSTILRCNEPQAMAELESLGSKPTKTQLQAWTRKPPVPRLSKVPGIVPVRPAAKDMDSRYKTSKSGFR